MEWHKFVWAINSTLEIELSELSIEWKCVKAVVDEANTSFVTIENFSAFLKWFGPLSGETMPTIKELLEQP